MSITLLFSKCHGSDYSNPIAKVRNYFVILIVKPSTHWIWSDFNKREPVISRAYPSDHKIPEAFQRQLAAKQSQASPSPGAGITLSIPSFGSAPTQDEGFTHGNGLLDDFKLWLSRHPGLTFDEARSRYREEQKAKQRRTGPKLHYHRERNISNLGGYIL